MKNYSIQRESILNIVRGTHSHPTAEWVFSKVKKALPNVSLGTVYRNLGLLADNDKIQAIHFNGVIHYDGNMKNHQHFYCIECKTIIDIHIPNKSFVSEVEQKTNHIISNSHVQMNGICKSCKSK